MYKKCLQKSDFLEELRKTILWTWQLINIHIAHRSGWLEQSTSYRRNLHQKRNVEMWVTAYFVFAMALFVYKIPKPYFFARWISKRFIYNQYVASLKRDLKLNYTNFCCKKKLNYSVCPPIWSMETLQPVIISVRLVTCSLAFFSLIFCVAILIIALDTIRKLLVTWEFFWFLSMNWWNNFRSLSLSLVLSQILHIFSLSLQSGEFVDVRKFSYITLIQKIDSTLCNSKLLESIIKDKLFIAV